MASYKSDVRWDTYDAVDAEVKRGFIKSRKLFKKHSEIWRYGNSASLCESCRQACRMCQRRYRTWWLSPGDGVEWTKTKKSLEDSVKANGCHLCIIISHAFSPEDISDFMELGKAANLGLLFSYRSSVRDPNGKLTWEQRNQIIPFGNMTLGQDEPDEYWLVISPQKVSKLRLQIDLPMQPMFQRTNIFGNITISPSQHSESRIITTSPSKHHSTGNPQNLKIASVWLQRPSTLIKIGAEAGASPRLVVSKDNVGAVAYCALSYCWGTDQATVLTLEKVQAYQKEIPITSLPATICDAIRLTRDLGFHYLWVDALCIAQGSKIDCEEQSPQMNDVYGLAALTIAAAGSSSVLKPMFQKRDPRQIRPCLINVQDLLTWGSNWPKAGDRWVVYPNEPESMVSDAFDKNPLCRRGWTLQERILSPRVLMFGEKQMLWSCVTMEAAETFPSGLNPRLSTPLHELRSLANLRQRFMRFLNVGALPSELWQDIVLLYSTTELTVGSDKLVALQGIVTRMSTVPERSSSLKQEVNKYLGTYEYVAGLWRDKNFRQNLLWRIRMGSKRSRPMEYRAPSWSWAAVDAEILPCEEYLPWTLNKPKDLATILDVQVDYPCSNGSIIKTGQVESGHVEVEAYCRPCYLRRNEDGKNYFSEMQSDAMTILARYSIGEYPFETAKERTVRLFESLKPYEEPDRVPLTYLPLCDPWWQGTEQRQLSESESPQFSTTCTLDCPEEIPVSKWIEVYCVPLLIVEMETDRYELATWECYEGLVLVPANESDIDPEAAPSIGASKQETFEGDATAAPRTFRRIGIFRFIINNRDRENRENELFGPESEPYANTKQEGKGIIGSHFESSRKRIKIRII